MTANAIIFSYNVEMEAGRKNVLVKKNPTPIMPAMVIAYCLILSQREPVTSLYANFCYDADIFRRKADIVNF